MGLYMTECYWKLFFLAEYEVERHDSPFMLRAKNTRSNLCVAKKLENKQKEDGNTVNVVILHLCLTKVMCKSYGRIT